jgi:hypothetical protein
MLALHFLAHHHLYAREALRIDDSRAVSGADHARTEQYQAQAEAQSYCGWPVHFEATWPFRR